MKKLVYYFLMATIIIGSTLASSFSSVSALTILPQNLLGDFDEDKIVNGNDRVNFISQYKNSYQSKYDIAPALKGSDLWEGIYSISNPDNKVDILDYIVLEKNQGKVKPNDTVVKPIGIQISGPAKVNVGESIELTATVIYSDGTSKVEGVTWSSGDGAVSSITSAGKLTGIKEGTVQVKAQKNDLEAVKNIVVEKVAVNGIKVYLKTTWDKPTLHYWNVTPAKPQSVWPGVAMTNEGDGWYSYTLEGAESTSIIFSNSGNSQTGDLTRTKGQWWYENGTWFSTDPRIDLEAPSIEATPAAGKKEETSLGVELIAKDNQDKNPKIYYTKDGSDPVIGQNQYTNKINISENTVIKAIAEDISGNKSEIITFEYILGQDVTPPVIVESPKAGRYEQPVSVSLSVTDNKDSGLSIYYTTDGTEPKAETQYLYKAPISISDSTTLRAISVDKSGNKASVTLSYYFGTTSERGDFREETIYFLMPTRFYDGDSTNNRYQRADYNSGNFENKDPGWRGDFKGLIAKLDYIKALGFTAIWITPPVLNRSDADYHGYHAWDMSKIDGRLESPGATYQDLINEIHKRGMKIVQDIVLNHSSRYGEKNLDPPKFWGDSEDPEWGANSPSKYYDKYNPDFEYDGISIEPISGKNYYNGDTYSKEAPNYPWANITNWGVQTQKNPQTGRWNHKYQWVDQTPELMNPKYYHNVFLKNWEDYTCQYGSIHSDCIDLNTEGKETQDYLIETYGKYIDMGVDGFRIDTAKHISRVMFNRRFIPAFKERGGENFYMTGEVLTKVHEVWNKGVAPLSAPFYTWKERKEYSADDVLAAKEGYDYELGQGVNNQPTSKNHLLDGNNYRPVDYSMKSGLDVIDCRMHVNFSDAPKAFSVRGDDIFYNDATWNTVYVDSHDYGPDTSSNRYAGGTNAWAENMSLMFTFRGIPTIFYGSEVEFQAGVPVDGDPNKLALKDSGRAYFGDHIEGSVKVSDFGVWSDASGTMKDSLNYPLAKHVARLNRIRRAVPALQKGQYSTENIQGSLAYKKRFTDSKKGIDSFALITISGSATFSDIPNGTYVDVVTGDKKVVSGGTLTAQCSGQGNMRVYVLDLPGNPAPGKIGEDGPFLK